MQCDQTVDEPRLESEQILECMCASAPVNEQTSDHVQATPYTPEHIIHPTANPDPHNTEPSAPEQSSNMEVLQAGQLMIKPTNSKSEAAPSKENAKYSPLSAPNQLKVDDGAKLDKLTDYGMYFARDNI